LLGLSLSKGGLAQRLLGLSMSKGGFAKLAIETVKKS
jgi:hypothetical protein